jgi:DHA1 family tetracycline resistance protein-like MFS transporter
VLDLVGFGIVLPILPLWAKDLGASTATVGLILASYSLAQLVGSPVLGRLSDRIGRKPLLVLALTGSAVGHLLTGLAGSVAMLFVARIVDGFSGASVSVAYAAAADMAGPRERHRLFGLLGAAFAVGFVVGPALGGLAALGGHRLPFFIAAGLCGLNALTAWWRLPETYPSGRDEARRLQVAAEPATRGAVRSTLAALGRGDEISRLLAVSLLAGLGFAGFEATFSLVGDARVGMTAATAGAVFALAGVVIAIVQGGLVDIVLNAWGERRTLRVGLVLFAVAFALLAPMRGWGLLLAGIIVLVMGQGLLSPSISSSLASSADPAQRGSTFGLNQSAAALARLVGPIVATWLFDVRGSGAPYVWGCALALIALAVSSLIRAPAGQDHSIITAS